MKKILETMKTPLEVESTIKRELKNNRNMTPIAGAKD